MSWWLAAMKKYVVFSGRARRLEYWMFTLINFVLTVASVFLDNIFGTADRVPGYGLIYSLFASVMILPTWAVGVRRLHDVGKSGWWLLLSLIPAIGSIWLFVLLITDSQPGDNEYGPDPKTEARSTAAPPRNRLAVILALVALLFIVLAITIGSWASWAIRSVYTARDTGSLSLRADYPSAVQVGENFRLKLYLQNESQRTIFVKDIDVHQGHMTGPSILDHAVVIETNPIMRATDLVMNGRSFGYSRSIRVGETQVVVFDFQATTPAETHTDFMIYVDDSTTTLWDVAINIDP